MPPYATARRLDVALIELLSDGVVAGHTARMISSMIGRTLAANRRALALAAVLPRLATSAIGHGRLSSKHGRRSKHILGLRRKTSA